MKMLARAAFALSAALVCLVATPVTASTTVTIYGGGGSAASVTLPDTMAAALIATGRAVVEDPRDNDRLSAIIATFSSTNAAFLSCLGHNSCASPPIVGVGTLDFSDPTQSAFIL